ncbi:diguanylate cyclase [Salipiger aestuarii]|uniref:PAS domain S-box-containing protein n=1 Tax=Salipiger aestuarii TaxID=568098 RepID=A0A327XRL3_9RHOB|nr:PAS domain-containing protein [Salipiger aestuarii]EIE52851.1 putative PAS/PAC sensor protein [Citreicella sp. 357]KAB2539873.1 diguanylate cyclase [Salipiger aestuarii]RAK11304.1 PAS domain S-box-containing protein [Salipiger aestuarii]
MTETQGPPDRLIACLRRSGIAIALSEATRDVPLLFVNDGFCTLTGYDDCDILGRNCRFLQGRDTQATDRAGLRDFVRGAGNDSGRFPVLNYRKDGTRFQNYVFMARIRGTCGDLRYILASQFDMTGALQRSGIAANDTQLRHVLAEIRQIGREHGLAMMSSAQQLAESVAVMARLSLR